MSARLVSLMILSVALFSAVPAAVAADSPTDREVVAVLEVREKSAQDIARIMARLSAREKNDLIRQQAIIDDLLEKHPDPATIRPDDKQRLWNATKIIDSIIAGESRIADEQLVCRQERKIGSQLPKRICRTKAQMEREREEAQRGIDEASRIQTRS